MYLGSHTSLVLIELLALYKSLELFESKVNCIFSSTGWYYKYTSQECWEPSGSSTINA